MEEEFLESRVNLFVALAPIARVKNLSNELIKNMAQNKISIEQFLINSSIYEIFGT